MISMALEVVHQGGDGTTVPYGPLFDDIRKNRGFVDARGRPDVAASIAEGSESAALRNLLIRISEENVYFSLGCDLGTHPEPEAKATLRQVAGGYVQVVGMDYERLSTDNYDEFGSRIERGLRAKSQGRSWRLWLQGCYVDFKLPDRPAVMAPNMWIWFFARAKTEKRAVEGREELIATLSDVLHSTRTVEALKAS
jgi:hypothetical protein